MRYTTESFVDMAKSIHGNKYDYSQVVYKNTKTKVQIICPKHGLFEQIPEKHLREGCGCPRCVGNVKKNVDIFVEDAKRVHGDTYDYSKVVYVNNKQPVEIVCREHGSFWQSPSNHLLGKGCSRCANNVRLTTDQFVEKSRAVHGDKYDYSDVVYQGNRVPVVIKCPIHGRFEQVPYVHLRGNGCPVCGMENSHFHRDASKAYEKAVQTFRKKYGVDNPMAVDEIRQRHLDAVRSDEVNDKRICTKRENNSFNTSLIEYYLGELLREIFGKDDVFSNYVSDVYPYKCDYFIKSRNLYIELNAHWSHGGHWYDESVDGDTIVDWHQRSAFYQNAACTFSERDVEKRRVAKENNLNYVVFWKNDLSDVKQWISLGCPDGHDWLKEYSWLE